MENTWEYDRIEIKFTAAHQIATRLNELGTKEWEIIYYTEDKPKKFGAEGTVIIIVKRLKPA